MLGLHENMVTEAACSGGARFHEQRHGNEILSRSDGEVEGSRLNLTMIDAAKSMLRDILTQRYCIVAMER